MTDSQFDPSPLDPTNRFSDRVENYVAHRPSYPMEVIEFLERETGIEPDDTIADVGSGTGKLAEMFLTAGYAVVGVEPNEAMRLAGDRYLARFDRFRGVAGSAEATTLADASVRLVVAGQAFHWFEPRATRTEFRRILPPGGGWVALVWNERRTDTTPFLRGYEALLRDNSPDYAAVQHRQYDRETLDDVLFGAGRTRLETFENRQLFDFAGLEGRMLSSSYVPTEGPVLDRMRAELRRIYDETNEGGRVSFDYDTKVFYGRLD